MGRPDRTFSTCPNRWSMIVVRTLSFLPPSSPAARGRPGWAHHNCQVIISQAIPRPEVVAHRLMKRPPRLFLAIKAWYRRRPTSQPNHPWRFWGPVARETRFRILPHPRKHDLIKPFCALSDYYKPSEGENMNHAIYGTIWL